MTARSGIGTAHGTFGELLQGTLPDERPFLVTFPIDSWARAVFWPRPDAAAVSVEPVGKSKSRLLADRMLRAYGRTGGGSLRLSGQIPEGKGLASSSADLVATARAVADALTVRLDAEATEWFLRGIEPSDGVMHPGVVSYYHREVRLRERLGFLPPMTVVAHDTGGVVDTVRFNRSQQLPGRRTRQEYAALLAALGEAVAAGDLPAVGRIATRSAELRLGPEPGLRFEVMRRICQDVGGLGVVIAHSGTYLGVLVGEEQPGSERVATACARCAELPGAVTIVRTLGPEVRRGSSSFSHHAGSVGGDHAL